MIVRERRRTGERMEGGTDVPVGQPRYSSADKGSEEGRAPSSADFLLGDRIHARHSRHESGRWDRQEHTGSLKTAWVPGWISQTLSFIKKDILGIMDMEDFEKLEFVDEQKVKQRRNWKRKIWFAVAFLFFALAVWGVLAIGATTERSPVWTQKLFRSRGEHAERQTSGREQYLVGVGKADITG